MKIHRRVWVALVWIGLGATVHGQNEAGSRSGAWSIAPLFDVTAVHDSNIDRVTTGDEDATFFDAKAALRLGYDVPDTSLSVLGFFGQRSFTEESERNFSTGGEFLTLRHDPGSRVAFSLQQSYRKVEDQDTFGTATEVGGMAADAFLDADARARREIHEAGALLETTPTDKLSADLGYRYNQTDFDSPDLFDIDSHAVQVDLGRKMTDKMSAIMTGLGGLQESESVDDAAEYSIVRIGLRMKGSDKLNYKAGVGHQHLDRPEEQEAESGFHYDATANWEITDKSTLLVEGRNGMQISSIHRANVVDFSVLRLALQFQVRPSVLVTAGGVYRIDDYADPVLHLGEMVDREDKGASVHLRSDFLMPRNNLRFFAECSYEDVDSTIRDYQITRFSLGINVML